MASSPDLPSESQNLGEALQPYWAHDFAVARKEGPLRNDPAFFS